MVGRGKNPWCAESNLRQRGEVQPHVVGIEVAVAAHVLKGGFGVGRALRRLAQGETAVAQMAEMAALAVGRRPVGRLEQKISPFCSHETEDRRVEHCAQVVCVGDECVLDAGFEQPVKEAGGGDGCEKITVAGWAPLELRVVREYRRNHPAREDLRYLVLEESEPQVFTHEIAVVGEGRLRVCCGAKAVHQKERDPCSDPISQGEHLTGYEVEETQPAAHREERFGAVEAHRGSETAVELDHHHRVEPGRAGLPVRLEVVGIGKIRYGTDFVLGEDPAVAATKAPEVHRE